MEEKFPFEELRAEFVDEISCDGDGGCLWFSHPAFCVINELKVHVERCEDDKMTVSFSMKELHRRYGEWMIAKRRDLAGSFTKN